AAVLRQSLGDLVPLAEARGIDLGLLASEPAEVRADARDLRSVFDNLLENALRYTPAGGRVDVSLKHVDGSLQVEVLDTGPGIPPELLERVFDRFYRVLGNGTQGSGLGLAIAQSAAGRAGMRIELMNRSDCRGLAARVRFTAA
ncbi:MAG TPA: sensor histidine kinase, partial [Gammaproteobacteria bacterium]|nr:sensor histidine kinase [Gammaproteobacteria bacterium]